MTTQHAQSDLAVESFLALRAGFFDEAAEPRSYRLRDKRNTQDDPLDEYVETILSKQLPKGVHCSRAPGALTTPDLVVMRPALCNGTPRAVLASDLTRIVALEAKKLERTAAGAVARGSGLDYNTTPPCGTVRTIPAGDGRTFYCYRLPSDVRKGERQFSLLNPFPSPTRTQKTQPRGRFRLSIRPSD